MADVKKERDELIKSIATLTTTVNSLSLIIKGDGSEEAEIDALSTAFRYIASKFPVYTFEAMLDKTPAWINWAVQQAVQVEMDQYKRISAMLGFRDKEVQPVKENPLHKLRTWGIG